MHNWAYYIKVDSFPIYKLQVLWCNVKLFGLVGVLLATQIALLQKVEETKAV